MTYEQIIIALFSLIIGHISGLIACVWVFQSLQRNEKEAKTEGKKDLPGLQPHDSDDQSIWSLPRLPETKRSTITAFRPAGSSANIKRN
jgi:uncharacterized SAM-binding protein YcdF (DUF218 family)